MEWKTLFMLLVFVPKSLIISLMIIITVTRGVIDDLIKGLKEERAGRRRIKNGLYR